MNFKGRNKISPEFNMSSMTDIVFLLLNLFIILNTKAYVIMSLLPGMLLWVNSAYLKNTKGYS